MTSIESNPTIVMGDFNAKVGVRTNPSETATGSFGLGQRNERGDTLIEWTTSKDYKIMNTLFHKKIEWRWIWRSPDGKTKNIEHLQAIHENSNSQTGENTRRESTQRTGRIQRRVLNDRSHPCHKSTEGEVPRIQNTILYSFH